MPTNKKFEQIARQQEALVRSLAGKGPALPGMDLARLEETRQSLIRKRARAVARTYPQMAAALGADFSIPKFAECLGTGAVGAVRISFGLGSVCKDVKRVASFLGRYARTARDTPAV